MPVATVPHQDLTTIQAIAGVPSNREIEIDVIYPSIAAGPLGRAIGVVMGIARHVPFLPLRLLTYVLLGIPMSGLAVLAYGLNKLFGTCYVLTNRSVTPRSIIGARTGKPVALADIAQIDLLTSHAGYHYHRVGDLNLRNAQGDLLMTIPAIVFPQRLRQALLETQAARLLSDESLSHIQQRAR